MAAAAGVGGAGGAENFFFPPCRIRLLQGTHPRLCGPCAADQGAEKAMDRLADMALSLGKGRRERGWVVQAGKPVFRLQAWHCRVRSREWGLPGTHRSNPNPGQGLVTAGYAPGHCRVRTALTLTLTGTAGSMVVFDCRVRTKVW